MAFVEVRELANYLKMDEAALSDAQNTQLRTYIEMAEAVAAAHIGTTTLAAHDVSETIVLPRNRNSIQVSDGPIAETGNVTEVQVSGYDAMDLDDVKLPHYWVIWRDDDFPKYTDITVEYTAGWEEGDSAWGATLPALVRHAIVMIAGDVYQNPNQSIVMEHIGDYTIQRAGSRPGQLVTAIPDRAMTLLAPFCKPEF